MTENYLSKIAFDRGLRVHKTLGPGLLESAYEAAMYYELLEYGLNVEKQKALPLVYRNVRLDTGYRLDLLVENKLIIEIKSIEAMNGLHMAQMITYLRLANCRLGLLMNFNTVMFRNGVRRIVNGL